MEDIFVGKIVRSVKIVSVEDSIGRTAEALRSSGLSELPVIGIGRIVGMISEESILRALTSGDPDEVSAHSIANLLSRDVVWVTPQMTARQAAEVLNDNGLQVVPVMDDYGNYRGVVSRSDIAGALAGTMKPPVVGGLATPLGVHLTCGNHRAGASDLGLGLAGASLALMGLAAMWIVYGIAYLLDKSGIVGHWSVVAMLQSPAIPVPNWMDAVRYVLLGATVPIFLVILRMVPMSGYHASEHQVVHAIENGEPLKPENVRNMPRVHPRCGTNILAVMVLFLLIRQILSEEVAMMVIVLIIIFARQTVGGYLQQYATTKPANDKQIRSGIAAGEGLIEKYRANPSQPVTGWQRIWNTGMPQAVIGSTLVTTVAGMLHIMPPNF